MHSPLPWKLETGVNFPNTPEPETWVGICAADGTMVLYDTIKGTVDDNDAVRTMLDNAALLAAAPQLLDACKAWVAYFDRLNEDTEPGDRLASLRNTFHRIRVEKTRAAIAKAEGKV